MNSHRAKCQVLRECCNELRIAIEGNKDQFVSKLLGKDLIPLEATRKDAGALVTSVQYRLEGDEEMWDNLIDVLEACGSKALWKNLKDKLARKMGQKSVQSSDFLVGKASSEAGAIEEIDWDEKATEHPQLLESQTTIAANAKSKLISPKSVKETAHQQPPTPYAMKPNGDGELGLALIINNIEFQAPSDKAQKQLEKRSGSDKDAKRLKDTFKEMKYDVRTRKNLTSEKMISFLQSAVEDDIDCNHSSVVVCVLSHGCQEGVYGVDNKPVSINTLTSVLNNQNCTALLGKPKLFFIQACRGTGTPEVVLKMSYTSRSKDVADAEEVSSQWCKLPPDSDIFVGHSTVPDAVARRHPDNGSLYIQKLCDILMKHYCEWSLEEMVSLVHLKLTEHEPIPIKKEDKVVEYLQVGQVVHTLRGSVYFK